MSRTAKSDTVVEPEIEAAVVTVAEPEPVPAVPVVVARASQRAERIVTGWKEALAEFTTLVSKAHDVSFVAGDHTVAAHYLPLARILVVTRENGDVDSFHTQNVELGMKQGVAMARGRFTRIEAVLGVAKGVVMATLTRSEVEGAYAITTVSATAARYQPAPRK